MGLNVLQREKEVWKSNPNMQPELDNYNYILERQLKPEARRDVIEFLKKCNVKPTSMIDISDGLSRVFIFALLKVFDCQLYERKIPEPELIKHLWISIQTLLFPR